MIKKPYLLFLGDAPDDLAAKVAQGIKDWRPENVIGKLSLPSCQAQMDLPEMSLAVARAAGAETLVIGVANRGGVISASWMKVLLEVTGSRISRLMRLVSWVAPLVGVTSDLCVLQIAKSNVRRTDMHMPALHLSLAYAHFIASDLDIRFGDEPAPLRLT